MKSHVGQQLQVNQDISFSETREPLVSKRCLQGQLKHQYTESTAKRMFQVNLNRTILCEEMTKRILKLWNALTRW